VTLQKTASFFLDFRVQPQGQGWQGRERSECLAHDFLVRYDDMQHRSEPHSRMEDWLVGTKLNKKEVIEQVHEYFGPRTERESPFTALPRTSDKQGILKPNIPSRLSGN
jgi:hypothetical protein